MAINNYYHVTVAGAGLKDGSTWANAMDEPAFETHLEGAVVAGDVHFVMDGTYTMDSDINCSGRDGTAVSPIAIIGVKSGTTNEGANVVYSDWSRAVGDRPFIDGVTFEFRTGDYYVIRNITFQSSAADALDVGTGCVVENCAMDNDNGVSINRRAYSAGGYTRTVNCEISALHANGFITSTGSKFFFCYMHDMIEAANGVAASVGSSNNVFVFCIFDNCRVGINTTADTGHTILNNTFYDGATAINATTDISIAVINNIVESTSVSGFDWDTQTDANFFWKNHGNDARCTDMWVLVDITTVYQDYEVSTGDPVFDVAGADFALQNTSPNLDNGMSIILGVG